MKQASLIGIGVLAVAAANMMADFVSISSLQKQGIRVQSLLSDYYWIRGYGSWLNKDEQRLLDDYAFATALNPQNLNYWRLAAQTIAYDLPSWEDDDGSAYDEASGKRREYYAELSLEFFERSRAYFEDDENWFMAAAFISETALNDRLRAIRYLAEAVKLPDISFSTGRTYARLLVEGGELKEAREFLVSWLPKLEIEGSHSQEVRDRIDSIESEINL